MYWSRKMTYDRKFTGHKRKETGLPFPESHSSRRALLLWHQQNCKTSTRVPACQNELRKFSVLLWLASLVNPTVDTRQYAVARMGTRHGSQKHSMRPDGSGETKYNVYCWGTSGGTKIVCRCGNKLGSGRPVNPSKKFERSRTTPIDSENRIDQSRKMSLRSNSERFFRN